MDGGEVHREVCDDRGVGLLQLDDDGEIVVTLRDRVEQVRHAHVVEIVVRAAGDLGEGMVRLPLAVEGPDHVLGVQFTRRREAVHARVELDALAQLEGEGLAVVRDGPAFGQRGNHFGGAGLELHEAVVNGAGGIESGAGGVDRGGEILRRAFRAIHQRLCVGCTRHQHGGGDNGCTQQSFYLHLELPVFSLLPLRGILHLSTFLPRAKWR